MSIILNASIVTLTHHYYYYCTSRFPSEVITNFALLNRRSSVFEVDET